MTYHLKRVSPVLRPIYVHHIPEFKLGLHIKLSIQVTIFYVNFSSKMRNLLNISL